MKLCLVVILLFLFWFYYIRSDYEGFESKPTGSHKDSMVNQLFNNKNAIQHKTLPEIKKELPWMDVVTLEDSRKLLSEGQWTKEQLNKLF